MFNKIITHRKKKKKNVTFLFLDKDFSKIPKKENYFR